MSGRLPFDPDRMRAKADASAAPRRPGDEAPWTISKLAARIGRALESGLPTSVRVVGEVSGCRERTHWYFDLKDSSASIACVLFASAARRPGVVTPENGRTVVARGRVEFYAPSGRTSLIVDRLEPVGVGAQELAFQKLCDELRALGWFDESRKRAIPSLPRLVAVVTSRSGAALQDVLQTARQRFPAVEWGVLDAPMQGEGAGERIAEAIGRVAKDAGRLGVDALLLTRGGGSAQDLWAFNERVVAEAIVACPIPVVAAIGHETDLTIAELVADLRCATPTQAAMRLTPDRDALVQEWTSRSLRLRRAARRSVDDAASRLRRARSRPALADPCGLLGARRETLSRVTYRLGASTRALLSNAWRRVERAEARLRRAPQARASGAGARMGAAAARLEGAMARRIERSDPARMAESLRKALATALAQREALLAASERELRAVSPIATLERGFTATLGADGRLLRSTRDPEPGEVITTRFADGRVVSRLPGGRTGEDQMDLFGKGG